MIYFRNNLIHCQGFRRNITQQKNHVLLGYVLSLRMKNYYLNTKTSRLLFTDKGLLAFIPTLIHLDQRCGTPVEHRLDLQLHQSFFRIELERPLEVLPHFAQASLVQLL